MIEINEVNSFFEIMGFSFKYHGNYCGPNWSAGKYQGSVAHSDVPAIDEFDKTCQRHDSSYALAKTPADRIRADNKFYRQNFGKGFKRSLAALAVGGQNWVRKNLGYDLSGPLSSSKKMPPVRKRKSSGSKGSLSKRVKLEVAKSKASNMFKRQPRLKRTRKHYKVRARYSGKFKKRYVGRRPTKYNLDGAIAKLEDGGTEVTNNKSSVYVGHGVAPGAVLKNLYKAIVKKLCIEAKLEFQNWTDVISKRLNLVTNPSYLDIRVSYLSGSSDSGAPAVVASGTPVTGTFKQMADDLESNIRTVIGTALGNVGNIRFVNFTLVYYIAENEEIPAASLAAQDAMVDFEFISNLVIQNRTLDATGQWNTDSVSNNPIHGKLYRSAKGWNNGFDLTSTYVNASVTTQDPLYTAYNTGIINTTSVLTQTDILTKPPPGWVLGAKHSAVVVQPGEIKRMKMKFKCSMSLNTMFQKLSKYVMTALSGAGAKKFEFGFAEMVGLECLLNDRTEVSELQVGWELNQVYMTKIRRRRVRTLPFVQVN